MWITELLFVITTLLSHEQCFYKIPMFKQKIYFPKIK